MDLKGKVALFPSGKTTIDIVDIANGEVVQQYDVLGTLGEGGTSIQKNIAAMAVCAPYHGVHVINMMTGVTLFKFMLPDGGFVTVALSKDATTLVVGTETGMLKQ